MAVHRIGEPRAITTGMTSAERKRFARRIVEMERRLRRERPQRGRRFVRASGGK